MSTRSVFRLRLEPAAILDLLLALDGRNVLSVEGLPPDAEVVSFTAGPRDGTLTFEIATACLGLPGRRTITCRLVDRLPDPPAAVREGAD